MKVNIKGLVFVGFAAAILSANAMADPAAASPINTVTSKSYVDAKISSAENISSTSTTTAPNEKQVYDALATKQPIQSDSSYKVGQSNTWQPLNSAVAVSGYLAKTNETNGSVTLNIDTANQLQTDGSSLTSGSSKLITEGAVAAAIAANGGAVNSGVLTVEQNNVQIGQFNANDSTSPTIDIVAPSWDATSTDAGYIDGKPTITNDSSVIDTAESTDTKVVPTTYAVQQYVDAADSALQSQITALQSDNVQADWNQTSTTAADFIKNKPQDIVNVLNGVQVDGTDLTIDADKKVNLGAAAGAGLAAEVANSDTGLVSGDQVYDYVQGITHGNNIPAQNSGICTDSTPCALVAELNTSTNEMEQHWRVMAVSANQNPAAGTLGDAQ